MTTFETKTIDQGNFSIGKYFYDFLDIYGKRWRLITNSRPDDTKKLGVLTGNLMNVPRGINGEKNYLPTLKIFLGSLIPGKVEFGDIKIKRS